MIMRITGSTPIGGVQGRTSKKKSSAGDSAFAPDMGADEVKSSSTAGGAAIQGMDALLALQEVDELSQRRSKAARHGHSLLDTLESVRADLLAGVVSEDRLELLAQRVAQRPESGDPQVDSVLAEIDLRVKVELAKLGRYLPE